MNAPEQDVEIVLVEDNPNDVELIMRVFKKHNVANKVLLLKDGAEAVDFFFATGKRGMGALGSAPKVVLLDLKLPKLNGIEVLRRMKMDDRTKNIPVVVLTSSNESSDVKDAYESGVNSYVTKPMKFTDFAKVVAELKLYWLLLNQRPGQ